MKKATYLRRLIQQVNQEVKEYRERNVRDGTDDMFGDIPELGKKATFKDCFNKLGELSYDYETVMVILMQASCDDWKTRDTAVLMRSGVMSGWDT